MKQIITKDGSITYHNKKFDETYHSISGAEEEAIKKYVEPLHTNESNIKVIDFCFGLGYNSAALIDKFSNKKIKITAIENDLQILNQIPKIKTSFKSYKLIQEIAMQINENQSEYLNQKGMITIKLIIKNAKEEINKLPNNNFNCVLFDPFSPKKQPELWTKDIFKTLYNKMKPRSMLTTYSCASQVRKNMQVAGFIVKDGPTVGRRAPSTICIKV